MLTDTILNEVGKANFIKGQYYNGNVELVYKCTKPEGILYEFEVSSESFSGSYYNVGVIIDKNKIIKTTCNCPQFYKFHSCKHIAASLIEYEDSIFDSEINSLQISHNILSSFYKENKKSITSVKKELTLTVNFEVITNYYFNTVSILPQFKIGETKLYNLNSKMSRFIDSYTNEEPMVFGKDFTYNPNNHFFNEDDKKIIEYLKNMDNSSYCNWGHISFSYDNMESLLNILNNKTFSVNGVKMKTEYKKQNPISFHLEFIDEKYVLSFENNNLFKLANSFYIYDEKVYKLPKKTIKLLNTLEENNMNCLVFDDKDFSLFKDGVLPLIKDNIVLADNIQDKITIMWQPKPKIYLDYHNKCINCILKFKYDKEEIDYFLEKDEVVKDTEYEQKVYEDILKYGFIQKDNKILIEDIDKIGQFLDEGLTKLSENYDVYTSKKLSSTKVVAPNVKSNFSIGKDNIMSYKFDLNDIDSSEIDKVLNNLKAKKDIIDLKVVIYSI